MLNSWTDSFLIPDNLIQLGLLDGGFLNLVTFNIMIHIIHICFSVVWIHLCSILKVPLHSCSCIHAIGTAHGIAWGSNYMNNKYEETSFYTVIDFKSKIQLISLLYHRRCSLLRVKCQLTKNAAKLLAVISIPMWLVATWSSQWTTIYIYI